MSKLANLQTLNDLLNRLHYSLLQYMREGWPWANATKPDQERYQSVLDLALKQGYGVERLADFLLERDQIVQNSNYPFDGSALNYTTLDFLKPKLIADQEGLVDQLKQAVATSNGDAEALRLLEQLLADEEQTLTQLKEF
jgi:hypothetical protein